MNTYETTRNIFIIERRTAQRCEIAKSSTPEFRDQSSGLDEYDQDGEQAWKRRSTGSTVQTAPKPLFRRCGRSLRREAGPCATAPFDLQKRSAKINPKR